MTRLQGEVITVRAVLFTLFMAIFNLKQFGLASLLVVANTGLAQAQEINSYEDFKLYCSDGAYQYDVASPYCDDYKQYYQDRIQEKLNRQPSINTESEKVERRSTNSTKITGYAGVSLGAFFPNEDDIDTGFDEDILNTGFGGSVFIGAKWNKYLGM